MQIIHLRWLLILAVLFPAMSGVRAGVFTEDGWGIQVPVWLNTHPGTAGAGMCTGDSLTVNMFNPAANGSSKRTRLYQSLGLNNDGAWDGHTSYWNSRLQFSGTALVMNMRRMTFGVMLQPLSDAEYSTHTYDNDPVFSEDYYVTQYRRGGLYRAGIMAAMEVNPRLYFGMQLAHLGGDIRDVWTLNYAGSAPPYDTQVVRNEDLHGWSTRFGIVYHPHDRWQVGIVYAPTTSLADRISLQSVSADTVERQNQDDVVYPGELALGVRFSWGRNYLQGDFLYSDLSETQMNSGELGDARYGLFLGAGRIGLNYSSVAWWERLTYETGFSHQNTGLRLQNNDVWETALSLGIGYTPVRMAHRYMTGVQLINRGDQSLHGRQEIAIRWYVTLMLKERWFHRRKDTY